MRHAYDPGQAAAHSRKVKYLSVTCPVCGAKVGQRCFNQSFTSPRHHERDQALHVKLQKEGK